MNKKVLYMHYFGKEVIYNKFLKNKLDIEMTNTDFAGQAIRNIDESNKLIAEFIKKKQPFALVRPGTGEINDAAIWEEESVFGKPLYQRKPHTSLVFNSKEELNQYEDKLRKDLHEADIFASFIDMPLEEYLVKQYAPKATIIDYRFLEPIKAEHPWTLALKGKKVLVISPFADKLVKQYNNIDKIFPGKEVLPNLTLIPLKSVWYIGPEKKILRLGLRHLNFYLMKR